MNSHIRIWSIGSHPNPKTLFPKLKDLSVRFQDPKPRNKVKIAPGTQRIYPRFAGSWFADPRGRVGLKLIGNLEIFRLKFWPYFKILGREAPRIDSFLKKLPYKRTWPSYTDLILLIRQNILSFDLRSLQIIVSLFQKVFILQIALKWFQLDFLFELREVNCINLFNIFNFYKTMAL